MNHIKIFSKSLLLILIAQSFNSIFTKENNQNIEPKIEITTTNNIEDSATITLNITLAKNQLMYENSVDMSINSPNITLSKWLVNKNSKKNYDPNFNEMPAFNGSFAITINAKSKNKQPENANLHFSFLLNTNKHIVEKVYSLSLFHRIPITPKQAPSKIQKIISHQSDTPNKDYKTVSVWTKITQFSNWIQTALRTSDSLWLRLVLVFLLGVLMSLTPCIYPMIPITAGILQSQGSSSIGRSFVLALTYTLGVSTTFALFGLVAASTGHLFGQLLVSPIFILIIVTILAYLGLSMFGLYDMYTPTFMQNNGFSQKKGSLISLFLFGAVSGSIASPCLSPGLALLLTIVATLGSKLLGFLMLFIFGLGLSMPLLIIGTFSNSINIIPQSGEWMVEIKKIFGFMLLGMCIYFLSNILPTHIISWIIVAFIAGSGIYYLQNISDEDSKTWRIIKNILGISLIVLSIIISVQAIYKTYFTKVIACENTAWLTNYNEAIARAKNQNKKLIIDCGADWCSVCKAIDKYVFEDNKVKTALCSLVQLKVDATDQDSEPYKSFKTKYNLMGVPAILIIDPHTGEQLQRWGSELYELPKDEFIKFVDDIK
jgi:thiol:disulfide interchange protein DsbD